MTVSHFINLSNGAEYLPTIPVDGFVRIQSTACEQKRWWYIISELDYNFLLHVALGNKVFVYDTSSKKKVSRALFQGLEWVKFVLNKVWLSNEIIPVVKGCNCYGYFMCCFQEPDKFRIPAITRLRYIERLILPKIIDINPVACKSKLDGKYIELGNKIIEWNRNKTG